MAVPSVVVLCMAADRCNNTSLLTVGNMLSA